MFKLLIVDDEFHIRDGFANAIAWEQYDIEVIGTAANGLEALEKIKTSKPDIIITDIYMDEMNGLNLIRKVREEYLEIKIIVISGYEEFEYAKEAIDLRVFTYLLKPILPKQLIKTVCDAIEAIKADKIQKNKIDMLEDKVKENYSHILDGFLNNLIEGRINEPDELKQMGNFLDIRFDEALYYCVVYSIDNYQELNERHSYKEIYLLMMGICEIANETLMNNFVSYTVLKDQGLIASIIGCKMNSKACDVLLNDSLEEIKEKVKMLLKQTITIGIGGYTENILQIGKKYHSAIKALTYRIAVGKDSIIHVNDIVSMDWNVYNYPSDIEESIIKNFNIGDKSRVETSLSNFFEELAVQDFPREGIRTAVLQLFALVSRKLMDKGLNIYKIYDEALKDPLKALDTFESLDEVKNWMITIFTFSIDYIHNNIKTIAKTAINKAQDYIRQNFSDPDISLISIAEHVYMNPSYLSKMYKEETGESYIDFLTDLRMENAKKMLKESNMRVSDIGLAAGYRGISYFCTLFKKNTGFSPAEFRRR